MSTTNDITFVKPRCDNKDCNTIVPLPPDNSETPFCPVHLPGFQEVFGRSAVDTEKVQKPNQEKKGNKMESCHHNESVTVIRLDGANHVFDSVKSESGDTVHEVCAQCHIEPKHFIGFVVQNQKTRGDKIEIDPTNPAHFAKLLTIKSTPYWLLANGNLGIPRQGLDTITGYKLVRPLTKRITIVKDKTKSLVRSGLVSDFLLAQQTFPLSEQDLAEARRASGFNIETLKAKLGRKRHRKQSFNQVKEDEQ